MTLFEVEGWDVKMVPVHEATRRLSKKRKRQCHFDHNQIESAEVNFEKLARLTGLPETSASSGPRNVEECQKPRRKKRHSRHITKNKETSCTRGGEFISSVPSSSDRESSPKKAKHQQERDLRPSKTIYENSKQKTLSDVSLTPLQKGMKEGLNGARFRLVCSLFSGKEDGQFLLAA